VHVLGIHLGEHASACLIADDGRAIATSESQQDRDPAAIRRDALGRVFATVPSRAIAACLAWAGVRLDELDLVIVTGEVIHALDRPPRNLCVADCVLQLPWSPHTRMHAIDHHLAHACSAFYPSGFAAAAVLVIDRGGGVTRRGAGGEPKRARATAYRATVAGFDRVLLVEDRDAPAGRNASSLGAVAELFATAILGTPDVGALLELAASGGDRLRDELARHWELTTAGYEVSPVLQPEGLTLFPGVLARAFGLSTSPGALAPAACADAAWAVRDLLECVAQHLGRIAVERAGLPRLCVAGEAAAHGLARGGAPWATEIYAPPVVGEAGAAVGAALYGWCRIVGAAPPPAIEQAFRGRTWDDAEVTDALAAPDATASPDALDALAAQLAGGAIVAWFDGGAELDGGWAGARCLLADPRRADASSVRAWTASVRAEDAATYFELVAASPFGHWRARLAPGRASELPRVARRDGCARLHTIDRVRAPRLHDLLGRFARRAHMPLLASSPLRAGDGLAPETPRDAVAAWRGAQLDALYLQGHLLSAPRVTS
jgi:carbamoyltransferase